MQPHFNRVRQVEPCHQLELSSQALFLSIYALGAMPIQQQPLLSDTETRPNTDVVLNHRKSFRIHYPKMNNRFWEISVGILKITDRLKLAA